MMTTPAYLNRVLKMTEEAMTEARKGGGHESPVVAPTASPYTVICAHDDLETWREARTHGIGASEIAAAMGENSYKSPLRLWGEKTGKLLPPDLEDNEAVQWGNTLEPIVAEEFEKRAGVIVERWAMLLQSTSHPWALATPDYRVQGTDTPVQVKTTGAWRLKDWADGVPRPVLLQVQQEMLVTGAETAYVAVLVGGQRLLWAEVPRNPDIIGEIIRQGTAFWEEYVRADQWPDMTGTDDETEAVKALWPTGSGEEIGLPYEAVAWDDELSLIRVQAKLLEEREALLKNRLRADIGNAELAVLPNGVMYTLKAVTRKEHTVKASTFRQLRRVAP